jgi:hypothetical protein
MVRVEPLPEVIEVGLTVQLAPLGHPPTVRFTVCGFPLVTAVEMALVPVEFWLSVRLAGLALMEKSFGGAVVETFRGDEERGRVFNFLSGWARHAWWNLSTSELISIGIFAAGVAIYVTQSRRAYAASVPVAA